MSSDRKAFLLRVPPELWKDLEKWAADELRSINAQIEIVLRQAVEKRKSARGHKRKGRPGDEVNDGQDGQG